MNLTEIAKIRLVSQQIFESKFRTAKEIVNWLGAMQAQDYSMAKWAIGVRLHGSTDRSIETAINTGEILRTHLMRPTWHFVSSDDIHWMLDLTAPQIKSSLKSRHKELELTPSIINKSNKILENALSGDNQLSREELISELKKFKIAVDENRASHLFLMAELDKIICSGHLKGSKLTYALLRTRVPETKTLNRDEAIAKLTGKYFLSHCPATLYDFVWWSGLSVSDARLGLEMIKSKFISESFNSQTYIIPDSFSFPKTVNQVFVLPAYDEFIISYKDRSAAISPEIHERAVSSNGIFRPVIVIDGQVFGLWKRTIKKNKVFIETEFFRLPTKTQIKLIEEAFDIFGNFIDKKIELIL